MNWGGGKEEEAGGEKRLLPIAEGCENYCDSSSSSSQGVLWEGRSVRTEEGGVVCGGGRGRQILGGRGRGGGRCGNQFVREYLLC